VLLAADAGALRARRVLRQLIAAEQQAVTAGRDPAAAERVAAAG
jgi:hypothetical protein